MRDLAIRLIWDFLSPCEKRISNAEAKFEQAKATRSKELSDLCAKTGPAFRQLGEYSARLQTHLRSQNLASEFSPIASSDVSATPKVSLEAIYKHLEKLNRTTGAACEVKLPPVWPKSTWGRSLVIGALLALYLMSPRGLAVLGYPVIFIIFRRFVVAQIKSDCRNLEKDIQVLRLEVTAFENQFRQAHAEDEGESKKLLASELHKIEEGFRRTSQDFHEDVDTLWKETAYAGANWDDPIWTGWSPDPSPEFAARIGILSITAPKLQRALPQIDSAFRLPALVPFAENRCFLLNAAGKAKNSAADAFLSLMVRVLANTPAGKARFVFIDPVGLGQNVADFMALGDFSKDLINGKAWSEPQHIEQQLTLLTEHIETVIQTCLRKEFSSIRDYNRERHEIAQPFRFLVVNDFPVNFSEGSARRLVSIVKNGPRCGVFTFILRDTEKPLPHGFNLSDLEESATKVLFTSKIASDDQTHGGGFVWQEKDIEDFTLWLDGPPPHDLTRRVVKKSGELAIPAMKIDVPFEKLLASASLIKDYWWAASAADSLRVPLGPSGARGIQELALGSEQEAHALLVGRTGSGKTNLMHVLITALSLRYSPQEVQLYLVDFKGGVGFKRYAECRLPHAKVIAIESEREFGLSVLRALDNELKQRSDTFRSAGVDNLSAYRAKEAACGSSRPPVPRILLIVDEFQEFFSENDDLAQQAKMMFERLARQGRSFGIHFLLATQSLSGSAQLPSSIMGQIKVRIALPCSEADSRLILADDNKAARALSVAGEAIYNPLGGLVEGNNRFQVARFSDTDLSKYLPSLAERSPNGNVPIIFEGNEAAHLQACGALKETLSGLNWPEGRKSIDLPLGEPIAIAPSVTARLRRQSGGHLMILTRDENEGVGMCVACLVNILAQQHPDERRVWIADFSMADSEWTEHAEKIAGYFPGEVTVIRRQREVPAMLAMIAKEVQSRSDAISRQPTIHLMLQGMHRIKSLREDIEDEDGYNAVELLKTILKDGPELGVHVLAWADTWGNITRGLDRRTIGEFGLRVAAVMDSADSMNFLDSLAASKISKSHRAILYDEDRPGQLQMFRPYRMPSVEWLVETGKHLAGKVEQGSVRQTAASL